MNAIDWINTKYNEAKKLPHFKSGDSIKVYVNIKEGEKERVQVYEGVVIAIHRSGSNSTFTVRKVSYGVGVERIFPFASPFIQKIEVISVGKVRRAKLYYLRDLSGKKARIASVDKLDLLKAEPQTQRDSVEDTAPKQEVKAENNADLTA
ncbi:MAG: 50S ribosomal protein L19 [Deltaproteobacteria bacterium]|nr:50S ribosomal protein L19 [Deltaproteobacteria bacterium]